MRILRKLLGLGNYDPDWEHLQRQTQTSGILHYSRNDAPARALLLLVLTSFAWGTPAALGALLGLAIFVAGILLCEILLPGGRYTRITYQSPQQESLVAIALPLIFAFGWAIVGYDIIVTLSADWQITALVGMCALIGTSGIASSPYPVSALLSMIILAVAMWLGIRDAGMEMPTVFFLGVAGYIVMMQRAIVRISERDLDRVRDAAQLKASEDERMKAFAREQQAETRLIKAREEERIKADESRRAAMTKLAVSFKESMLSVIENLAQGIKRLQGASTLMHGAANEASQRTRSAMDAAEATSQAISQVAAATTQLRGSVELIDRDIEFQADAAKEATNATSMSATNVRSLNDSAAGMSRIIHLLKEVADQTNMLALNATIEAERAGTTGRGFSVVAQEVKKLASEAQSGMAEVAAFIEGIKTQMEQADGSMRTVSTQVEGISSRASQIAEAVGQQASATTDIDAGASMAAEFSRNLSSDMEVVSKSADEAQRVVSELAAIAELLSVQADALRQSSDDFLDTISAAA